mgnify:FL=1
MVGGVAGEFAPGAEELDGGGGGGFLQAELVGEEVLEDVGVTLAGEADDLAEGIDGGDFFGG